MLICDFMKRNVSKFGFTYGFSYSRFLNEVYLLRPSTPTYKFSTSRINPICNSAIG